MDGGKERREPEQDGGVGEKRPEVHRTAARPPANDNEWREDETRDQHDVDRHGGQEPTDSARDQWASAHPEEVLQRRRRRDAVPLADRADEEDLAGGHRRRQGPEDRELADPPWRHDEDERRDGTDRCARWDHASAPRPIPGEREDDDEEYEHAVCPRQRGEAGQEPGKDERARRTPQATRDHPQRAGHQRLEEGEVVGLGHERDGQRRDGNQDARAHRDHGVSARFAGDRPGQRRGGRTDQDERCCGRPRLRAEQGEERHLDEGREWHPVPERRDRQDRIGRDGAADLGEDPHDVDVEPVTLRYRARSIDVVVSVGIARIRIRRDEGRSDEEGKHVQDDGGTHGRCSVAPGLGPAAGTKGPSPSRHWRQRGSGCDRSSSMFPSTHRVRGRPTCLTSLPISIREPAVS